jgi:hypothetical protein
MMRGDNPVRKIDLRHTLRGAKVRRSIDEEIAKKRSEDQQDILNFRNDHSKCTPKKEEVEMLKILQNRQFDHATAKDGKFLEHLWKQSKGVENKEITNFRREIAIHRENG